MNKSIHGHSLIIGSDEEEKLSSLFWFDQSSQEDSEQSAVNDKTRALADFERNTFSDHLTGTDILSQRKDNLQDQTRLLFALDNIRSNVSSNNIDTVNQHSSLCRSDSSNYVSATDLNKPQEEVFDAVSELGQRISRFRTLNNEAEFDRESEEVSSTSDAGSITGRRPNSAQPFFTRDLWSSRPGGTDGYGCISNAPKSFIRPLMDHPHTRNIKKSDPVAKYFEYKRNWETFKAPGEKDRKELRWGIREQMFYKNQLPLVSSLFSFHFHCLFPTNVSPIPMNYGGHIYIQYKILNQQDIFIIPCICNIVNKYLLQFTFKVSSLIIGIS
ncbi:uncharacterized protein si:dkey-23f9.4 isoform X3 [Scyliorhinus canicula]|uniref:uncharacterized protein si:dkey-23f9.4 isoform X3 n=1 Tax=Scyliorhinus canicula TaxID=7830 RepID=UPI0018F360AE|nr:uncharacterized protein si:dkey-23f9.4 isoform X3 [Scyliorhinus canicula]